MLCAKRHGWMYNLFSSGHGHVRDHIDESDVSHGIGRTVSSLLGEGPVGFCGKTESGLCGNAWQKAQQIVYSLVYPFVLGVVDERVHDRVEHGQSVRAPPKTQ